MRTREGVLRDAKAGIARRARDSRVAAGVHPDVGGRERRIAGVAGRVEGPAVRPAAAEAFQPNAYIRIDPNDTVTIWSAQPDMGEGTKTSLPMLLVEELDADWSRVRIENAPLDGQKYGGQGVGGSDAIRSDWDRLRRLRRDGASPARARRRGSSGRVPERECETERGVVRHAASRRQARYGDLAATAAALTVPAERAAEGSGRAIG